MSIPNKTLLEAAEKFGTPLYVYDGDTVVQRYNDLYDFIKYPQLKIHYAMKANFSFAILKLLCEAGASEDEKNWLLQPGLIHFSWKKNPTPRPPCRRLQIR